LEICSTGGEGGRALRADAGTALLLVDHPEEPMEEPEIWEARLSVHAPKYERARRILQDVLTRTTQSRSLADEVDDLA